MEKQLTRKVSQDSHHHGCMFNIFGLFAFRHRHDFRRLLSDREQGEQLLSGSTRSNKTQNFIHLGIESNINFNEEGMVKTNRRKRRKMLSKARIKAFIVGEMMKKRVSPQRTPPASSRLQRLYSIHHMGSEDSETTDDEHLNSSDKSSCYTTSSSSDSHGESTLLPVLSEELPNCCARYDGSEPLGAKNLMGEGKVEGVGRQLLERQALLQEILNEIRESLSKEQSDNKEIPRGRQSAKIFDALEVLNTNRELFLKILKDVGHPLSGHFQGSSRKNPLLTKSGTYPGTRSAGNVFSSRKLGRRSSNIFSLGMPSDDEITASDQSISSTSSELKMNPFKNIKRKIKQLLKENEKEHLRVSLDAVLHKVPYGPNSPDGQILATQRDKRDSPISSISYGTEGPRSGQIKRSASLNESIDRYSQLFESISQKDSVIKRSRTLRVSDSVSENETYLERRIRRRAYGRNHSLPNIPLYYVDCGVEDATSLAVLNSSSNRVDAIPSVESFVKLLSTQDFLSMTIAEEDEKPEENLSVSLAKANEDSSPVESMTSSQHQESTCSDNLDHLAVMEPERKNDIEATSTMEPSEDLNEQSCHDREDVTIADQSCITADTEIKLENNHFGEAKATIETPNQLNINELQSSNSQANIEEERRWNDSGNYPIPPNFHVDTQDEADFFYVRNILLKSGFNGKKLLETCHSLDETMLDPTLFDEVEGSLSKVGAHEHEMGSFAGSSLDHLLLFDLINEVLFEIYDRNFSSSSSCGLFSSQISRPLPIGNHVLEEVWGRISWHLDFRPQIDTTLEQVKARDFTKCDGWMNLQLDSECLGLDLEEWVLDDMLDELVEDLVLA